MQRLKLALRHDVPIRFRQFQSTTSDYKVAARFQKREDHPGFLWVIDIPENHFGARNIQDVSSRSNESETLFPPYSMFQVVEVSNQRCHLKALPWVWEEYEPRSAQGEPFDLDDEPITGCVRCCVSERALLRLLNHQDFEVVRRIRCLGDRSAEQIMDFRQRQGDLQSVRELASRVGLKETLVKKLLKEYKLLPA
eukprot:g26271.t1